jgi:predicted outer membrane lipoprotein
MSHLREVERRLSATVLIAAPLAGLLAGLWTQDHGGQIGEELEYIAENNGSWLTANYVSLLMGVLMTMAIGILIALVREHAPGFGYVGGALSVAGIYFHGSVVGYSLVQAPLIDSLPEDLVVSFADESMYDHVAFTTILLPFLGFFIGMILLAVALRRAGTAPAWVTAVIAAAPLTEFVGVRATSPELMYVLLTGGFGYIAAKVLRTEGGDRAPDLPLVEAQRAD